MREGAAGSPAGAVSILIRRRRDLILWGFTALCGKRTYVDHESWFRNIASILRICLNL